MTPKIDVVLARAVENLDWWFGSKVRELVNRTFVYNKGSQTDITIPDSPNVITEIMPNHGRESSTYIHHIIEHYDDLGDYTAFLQGNPHDHSSNVENKIQIFATMPAVQSDLFFVSDRFVADSRRGHGVGGELAWGKVYDTLFKGKAEGFVYSQGAQYIVSRRAITFRPRAWYQKIVNLYFPTEGPLTQLPAYTFEGLWQIMWDMQTPHIVSSAPVRRTMSV
jgi:hypothetical protein